MIETKRLSIRPIAVYEADAYYDITHDDTLKWNAFYESTRESARRTLMVSSFQYILWQGLLGIAEKNSGKLIGAIKIYRFTDDPLYDFDFFVTEKYKNQSIIEEAITAIICEMKEINKNPTCILSFKALTTNVQFIALMKNIKLIARRLKLPYSVEYAYSGNICVAECLEIKVK